MYSNGNRPLNKYNNRIGTQKARFRLCYFEQWQTNLSIFVFNVFRCGCILISFASAFTWIVRLQHTLNINFIRLKFREILKIFWFVIGCFVSITALAVAIYYRIYKTAQVRRRKRTTKCNLKTLTYTPRPIGYYVLCVYLIILARIPHLARLTYTNNSYSSTYESFEWFEHGFLQCAVGSFTSH